MLVKHIMDTGCGRVHEYSTHENYAVAASRWYSQLVRIHTYACTATQLNPCCEVQALRALNQVHDLTSSGSTHPHPTHDQPNQPWASATLKAISAGHLKVTSCLVIGAPLMPEGPLRPVTLPCCGFVVSDLGAQQLRSRGQCQLCHVPLAADAAVEENDAVARAVAAEERGLAPRLLRSAEVAVGEKIGAGS